MAMVDFCCLLDAMWRRVRFVFLSNFVRSLFAANCILPLYFVVL